ncbi:MAG: transposase [Chlorobium sp.]|nr:transposase [Chlorobium sp.]
MELKPLIALNEMLARPKDNRFNYFKHQDSSAVSEGLSCKIRLIKASARGVHSFESGNQVLLYLAISFPVKFCEEPFLI